jgi:hypothetical protein
VEVKKDNRLLLDLATRGYEALVTADFNQLYRPDECKLIRQGGFHHIRFEQSGMGVLATASAIATIVAGLTAVVPALERAEGQRLVLLKTVKCGTAHHEIRDPVIDPPDYWPGRGDRRTRMPQQRRAVDESSQQS